MTNHLSPEEAFALAATEFDDGDARPGLLAMAEAQADGDPARARAAYLRLRAAQLSGVPPPGARPAAPATPRAAARPAPPPPPPSEAKKTGLAVAIAALVFISLAALAFLFFGAGGEADSEAGADELVEEVVLGAEPVIVTVDCASTRRRVGGGSPGELLGSAVGSLLDAAGLEALVTVRNAGAAGEVVVAVAAYSESQPGALGREQTVSLAAGERRQLAFTFDPTPFDRGGACRAWAAPLGDPLSEFDAFVQTYNTRPAPAQPAERPAAPEPIERAPEVRPEPVIDPPAPDEPPPVSDPIPRTPQPEPPPADAGTPPDDGT